MPLLTTPTTTPHRPTSLAEPVTRVAAAASVLVRDVLAGPVRPAAVVAAGPRATYLEVAGHLLAVVAEDGVRLPCAVVMVGDAPPPAGPGVTVGAGAIHDGGRRIVEVRRWFDPRLRLARLDPAGVAALAAAVRSRPRLDRLLPADAVDGLAAGLAAGHPHGAASALVGRGSGLTPAGDDLLAGALAALRALGAPAAELLGDAVELLAPRRTTRLSAALLRAAADGAVIPPAAAVLRALATPGDGQAGVPPHRDLARATDRLLGVGHTSGWYLAAGLAVGATLALAEGVGGNR